MHPVVLQMVAGSECEPPSEYREAWHAQCQWALATAEAGAWWGTISSEPGSGGDLQRTKTVAWPDPDAAPGAYRLTGQKHFGSGAGISSYMVTFAVPAGESQPEVFIVDMRGLPWDGSAGLSLTAAWDGHGMIATQSHAFAFDQLPAVRLARPIDGPDSGPAHLGFLACCCSAVIAGIVEVAVQTARRQLAARGERLGAYERVEWARAEIEAWLVEAAYQAMLQSVETGADTFQRVLMGKTAIADLAESTLGRICRAIGGGSYDRASPFGHWFEDVRALGFLRPPWGAAYATLVDALLV
jgi:alkylation response protein AidB-like acyl-CoA dehydrogenase